MRQRLLLLAVGLCFAVAANAQVARWILKPEYDQIKENNIGLFEVVKQGKVGLYKPNMDTGVCEEILPPDTYTGIRPFHEGRAILYKDGVFVGFVNEHMEVITMPDGFNVRPGSEDFCCDKLLTYRVAGPITVYYYVGSDGACRVNGDSYVMAYPLSEGYACVKRALQDRGDLVHLYDLIDANGESVLPADMPRAYIDFLSSVSNGEAIMSWKGVFYKVLVDGKNTTVHPIYINDEESRKNRILYKDPKITEEGGNMRISLPNASFLFDTNRRLLEYSLLGQEPVVMPQQDKVEDRVVAASALSVIEDNGLFGLNYNDKELLPPQFEEIATIDGNIVTVKSNGRYGVLIIDDTESLTFSIRRNGQNKDVGFMHRNTKAELVASLPSYIDCKNAFVECGSDDCELLIYERDERYTTQGNFLIYDCDLTVPQDIQLEPTPHTYRFRIRYDDLVTTYYDVLVNEWFQLYYTVHIAQTEYTLLTPDDPISIDVRVDKTDDGRHDNDFYHKDVWVYQLMEDGSWSRIEHQKFNEEEYRFTISHVNSDKVDFKICVAESNCPAVEFPYTLNFHIPEPPADEGDTEAVIQQTVKVDLIAGKRRVQHSESVNMFVNEGFGNIDIQHNTSIVTLSK